MAATYCTKATDAILNCLQSLHDKAGGVWVWAAPPFRGVLCWRAHLSRELLPKGWRGCSLDIRLSPLNHDMCSPKGLRTFLDCLTSSKDRALHWFGTRCSSFVPLCQSVARRYPQNNFYGDMSRACVCDGNFQVEVTGFCMYLSMLLSCIPVLEQPLGSCMPNVPVSAEEPFCLVWYDQDCHLHGLLLRAVGQATPNLAPA